MKQSLWFQLMALMVISLALAALNNLRPNAAIEWVRDWPPYAQVANKETAAPPAETQVESADPQEAAAQTADFVTANAGIADIGLDQAYNIFQHARDFTFWIDARTPDLFEQGRIEGARLLNFYEQSQFLPEIEAAIAELQPVALVVYCKGKDCTDSHFLAEDLQARGYGNIFVYKDGFDDWYRAGYPIEGALAGQSSPEAAAEAGQRGDDPALAAETADLVTANAGIADIDRDQAYKIFQYARDFTLWIDARSPELYQKGHIEGARLLHFYEQNQFLPEIETAIAELQPVALVIYCKGKDCTDSHFLAEDLQARGYDNIFVYKDGFDDWYRAGYPIAGELAALADGPDTTAASAVPTPRALPDEKPKGMYLEHVLRDMVPFVLGLLLAIFWKRASRSRMWVLIACLSVGIFFIYAAIPKLDSPLLFAKSVWNYDIAPASLINFSALLLPAVELVAALFVITGFFRRGGSFMISALLVIFIAAVGFNLLRGHEFDCGCTSAAPLFPDLYLEGWNDKYTLLLRDLGLLAMSAMAFFSVKKPAAADG